MNINTGSASYIQADRILRIETSLGLDVFLPERMTMVEKVSDLFELSIAVRSKKTDIKPDDLVGKLVDVSVEQGMGERRTWNGLVIELMEGPPVTRGLRSYHLTIVPEHWLLTQKSDCRIWLNKTSVEVAEILMQEHKLLGPNTFGIVNKYTPKPQHYSVQFNETDWDYLNRRLEEDGIFYWFHHEGGEIGEVSATHRLHIASHQFGYQENDYQDIRYAMGSTDRNHISKFEKRFRFIPSSRTGRDWNFENPGSAQEASTPSLHKMPHSEGYELYEYPFIGGYGTGEKASEGIEYTQLEKQSRFRMMAAEVDHERIEGQSTVRTFSPGHRFKPYDVANPDNEFEEHAIIEIHHQAEDRSYETNEGDPDYTNTFVALPSRVPATPHRKTKRPRIEGQQIAIIAGPEGEEIWPDEYGRVKVWFPWDRRAKKDGSDTCWIRVGQNWAGGGFGGQIIPRIDMEVTVSYLDGDPDRPVITGVVPNSRQKVPYTLPENKTKSVFRTNTHKSEGFNELTFEDEAGREEIYVHGQKDYRMHIEDSRTKRVDNNQAESIGHNKTMEVGNNHHEVIGGNMTLMVGPNVLQGGVTAAMGVLRSKLGDLMTDKLRSFTDKLGFLAQETMGEGNMVIGVGKNKAETVMVSSTEIVGGAKTVTVGGGYQLAVQGMRHESTLIGAYEEVGQNKVIVAGKRMEFVCGKSMIQLNEDGTILIEGVKLLVNQKNEMTVKAGKIDLN